jgi:hypothetical protein
MPLKYVTTIAPAGIDFYAEDSVDGEPTDMTPRIGSLVMNAVAGYVAYYQKVSATVWVEIATIKSLTTGVLGIPMLMPVTLVAGNATTSIPLPYRNSGWRVVDFWITNSSGGAGAGTVTLQRGADNADISNALVPGAADAITRATTLVSSANLIASGGYLLFVRAGGWTAGVGYVLVIPA